ncbi:glutaminyl-peptide cyclotransferase [Streptomyces sp. NPDC004129]|uniref:glutaminyl-peptide cyclotransferase n=1 Tax=Streptomyces sp. NPDC004533 TaxID=3154278 RepID=UPI0033AAFED6
MCDRTRPVLSGTALLAGALLLVSCAAGGRAPGHAPAPAGDRISRHSPAPAAGAPAAHRAAERLRVKVLQTLPHDPAAFTEGLELVGRTLYEGTGISGDSWVQAGPPGRRPRVRASLPEPLFGEGITVLGRTLWQLTWQDRIAVERDATTLKELRRVRYPDEGWGICFQRDRHRLVTSDGSARLTFRDPRALAATGGVTVTENGAPLPRLNELECVGTAVYANVYDTDRIVRIDPATGAVTADIDASGLVRADRLAPGAVLNGIAAVPGTDQFLITGKYWPTMFRVTFAPVGGTGR